MGVIAGLVPAMTSIEWFDMTGTRSSYSGASSGDEPTIVCPGAKFIRPPLDARSLIAPLHHDPASGAIIRVIAVK